MNNPLSSEPEHALYPHPPGCAGWRLWQMVHEKTGATRSQYLRAFDRRNLLSTAEWNQVEAGRAGEAFTSAARGRTVVVLGEPTRRAIGLPRLLLHPLQWRGVTWRQIPHPSGRCRYYNDADARAVVVALLAELYDAAIADRELVS
jgi:hypothetical protein